MALRKIILVAEDEAFLRKKSKPITQFDSSLHQLLNDMIQTLNHHNGAGLAAVQVGVLKRVFITKTMETGLNEYINPQIIERSPKTKSVLEGCLSIPGRYDKVCRPTWVVVRAQDRNGNWFEQKLKGFAAQAVYHENDHLDGIIYTDLISKEDKK